MMMQAVQWAQTFNAADLALLDLLTALKTHNYHFITPTPATQARVLTRPDRRWAKTLRDILGWSLPFDRALLEPTILQALEAADMVMPEGVALRSRVRVSSLQGDLYVHSAFPTASADAVFFGPDSYRFADLIRDEVNRLPPAPTAHFVDIGTGAGVGAIVGAHAAPGARITMTDINPQALRFARINAAAAGVSAHAVLGANLDDVADPINIALANPPYIIDPAGRAYRDGGSMHGGAVALDMARMAVERLAPGGRLILYTGSAIIAGADPLRGALMGIAAAAGCAMRYRELDPDIFGEELAEDAYADVERIAVVGAILERPARVA